MFERLRVWHLTKVVVLKPKMVKIGATTIDCIFIGYTSNNCAYRFLVHKSDISDIHVNTIKEWNIL